MKIKRILEPFSLKNVTFSNRIVMSPMCMYSATENGEVTDWHIVHYGARALGGVGLMILEATAVESRGRISPHDLGLWDDLHMEGLKKIVDFAHDYGVKTGIQLAHAGRKAELGEEIEIIAPSPIPYQEESKTPREMTRRDIKEVVNAFAQAARRAKQVGFDVIELHAAHGYLLNEFLSPVTNKRTDEYGGSLENRFRIVREVIEAVQSEWGKESPLFVRISAVDYVDGGITIEDSVEIARLLKECGVDLIDVSTGAILPVRPPKIHAGYQVPYAERIKREVGIATGAVGLITRAEQAEEIIGNERADLVFLGRELLRDPQWLLRMKHKAGIPFDGPKPYIRGYR